MSTSLDAPLEPPVDDLLTIDQAARYLQISRKTLARWRDQRAIPFFVLPSGRTRFRRSELEAWMETRARRPRRG